MTDLPFDVDPESGSERLEMEFTGTSQHPVSLDPGEFRGMPQAAISANVMTIMRSIAPGVNFAEDDMELAAEAIKGANGEPTEQRE